MDEDKLDELRRVITESLRVQRGASKQVPYIDVGRSMLAATARQNHAIFARRGCGKTLLLHSSAARMPGPARCVYLNCEDFKKHSFPNVLIEVLDALFEELDRNLSGWFGKKKKSKEIIAAIRTELAQMRKRADAQTRDVVAAAERSEQNEDEVAAGVPASLTATSKATSQYKTAVENRYREHDSKIRDLDMWLPKLKSQIREFFTLSTNVDAVFIQIDDFYHLNRADQPYVMDYIHRLCKDLPIYFKIATLRHASVLYADRGGQPIGAQERHDYQPINIDFTLSDFEKTVDQNWKILTELARLAGVSDQDLEALFKGEGFGRLVLAGGGVPRDTLSLFLEILDQPLADHRIGKDDVRTLSRSNFERRIQELKQDAHGEEQGTLIKGIYVLRQFCMSKMTNIFLVSEQMMQQEDRVRDLLHRLLDYRIIHNAGSALTHKSTRDGTFQAFAIDIGSYAHMRKHRGRFTEVDVASRDARERMRSAPILMLEELEGLWKSAPSDAETALLGDLAEDENGSSDVAAS